MIEMLTGFGLIATYLSSFVDWRPPAEHPTRLPDSS
jgi:hypothetical protein